MGATERIPVLVTAEEKARIAHSASQAGMSMGEYLRKAAAAFDTADDEAALAAMIDQMNIATERAESAIDEALNFIDESNNRIAETEALYRATLDQ